jgi:hypothetical protein
MHPPYRITVTVQQPDDGIAIGIAKFLIIAKMR